MTYFDQIDTINDIFDQNYVLKPDRFRPFSPKMTYFDKIDPINYIFDQIYVQKPDLNNF